MQSYSQIREFIEENDVEFIRLAYFDVFGTQKNIAIMSGELERAMKYGISIDGAAIAGFDADIRSDLFLRPDPSTISIETCGRQGLPHVLRYRLSGRYAFRKGYPLYAQNSDGGSAVKRG